MHHGPVSGPYEPTCQGLAGIGKPIGEVGEQHQKLHHYRRAGEQLVGEPRRDEGVAQVDDHEAERAHEKVAVHLQVGHHLFALECVFELAKREAGEQAAVLQRGHPYAKEQAAVLCDHRAQGYSVEAYMLGEHYARSYVYPIDYQVFPHR